MKKFLAMILCILMLSSMLPMAFADEIAPPIGTIEPGDGGSDTQSEHVGWVYRYNDAGELEMRLWSYTYGYWLTDWLPA